jgi:hypothetical protein
MKFVVIGASVSLLALGACEERADDEALPDVGCLVENCDAAQVGDEPWDCLYEAEIPESMEDKAFPVIEFTGTRRGNFCRWNGRSLQYVVQTGGECPATRTFDAISRSALPELPKGRLLKKVKVGFGEDIDLAEYQEVNCGGEGAYAFPDNESERAEAQDLGILANTERFMIEGDVRDVFTLEIGIAQLRASTGLPVVAAFHSPRSLEVFWKPQEYPFQVDACAESVLFLEDYGSLVEGATCESLE